MSRKLLAIAIAMVVVLAVVLSIPFATAAETSTWDGYSSAVPAGTGEEDDPYLIASAANLKWFLDNCKTSSAYFKQTVDIVWSSFDGTSANKPASPNWTPMGTEAAPFAGHYDGGGNIISGLFLEGTNFVSIFGVVNNATFKNLTIDKSLIHGTGQKVCAFAAEAGGTVLFENCVSYANIIAEGSDNSFAAAFMGRDYNLVNATFRGCANFGEIKGKGAYVGGILGMAPTAYIENCANYGNCSFAATKATGAGIAGLLDAGTIKNCFNAGNISGGYAVGGFVGQARCNNADATHPLVIQNCLNIGTVTTLVASTNAKKNVMGTIGSSGTGGKEAVYSNGTVASINNVSLPERTMNSGAYLQGNADALISNLTFVAAEDLNVDKLVELGFDRSLWATSRQEIGNGLPTLSKRALSAMYPRAIPEPDPEDLIPRTYVFLDEDFNILATGYILPTDAIPAGPEAPEKKSTDLTWIYEFAGYEGYTAGMLMGREDRIFFPVYNKVENPILQQYRLVGEGTAANPYTIESALRLDLVNRMMNATGETIDFAIPGGTITLPVPANMKSACYKLTADIDWAAYAGSGENNWAPLTRKADPFTGTFDGGKHFISGLNIRETSGANGAGLFGCIENGAVVKNVIVKGGTFHAYQYAGGITGLLGDAGKMTIENCANYNTIIVDKDHVGGIVGGSQQGGQQGFTIRNCVNYGQVTSTGSSTIYAGGIGSQIALVDGSEYLVENCANFGDIGCRNDVNCIGGIVGQWGNSSGATEGVIRNCYNVGDISGLRLIGGITGRLYAGTIENCYNIGQIRNNEAEDTDESRASYPRHKMVGGIDGNNNLINGGGEITNTYFLKDCAQNVGCGIINNEGAELGRGKSIAGKTFELAKMQGADALTNMSLDASDWEATNICPILKGITIVPQYNGEYTAPEAPVTTPEPEQTTAAPTTTPEPEQTTAAPTTTPEPEQTTAAPTTTAAPETTTTPADDDTGANVGLIIGIVAAVVVVAVVAVVLIVKFKKK